MSVMPLAIQGIGLVTSVGLTAAESCAAFRAKISNPTPTRFIDSAGEWIQAHQVTLEQPWRGLTKLAKMAAMAIDEALQEVPRSEWNALPLLLCVAEPERPGRTDGLEDELIRMVRAELGVHFANESVVVPKGRVGVAVALLHARQLVAAGHPRVLIAATDSLLNWSALSHYEQEDRLLTTRNSNGFMPGEGAGAVLASKATGRHDLRLHGLGFATEHAHIESEVPLRGDGLTAALKAALVEAGEELHHISYRVSDASGEQYYFKEASLALNRTLRKRKGEFELWHPADSIGETGAVAGVVCLAAAGFASLKAYGPGPRAILHFGTDQGARAAVVSIRD